MRYFENDTREKVLRAIRRKRLSTLQTAQTIGLPWRAVQRTMRGLLREGLVNSTKKGRSITYKANPSYPPGPIL